MKIIHSTMFHAGRCRPILFCLLLLSASHECHAQQVSGQVTSGGVGRYKIGQWGLVRGQFNNVTAQDQQITAVVTQKSNPGTQFARSIVVPAGSTRISQWPVLVHPVDEDYFEYEYLFVDQQDGRETVDRRSNDSILESFVVVAKSAETKLEPEYCGHLYSVDASSEQHSEVTRTLSAFCRTASAQHAIIDCNQQQIQSSPEALDPLSQLVITSPDLWRFQQTCDSVRFWIQRGGKAVFFLDRVGEDSMRAVLGDSLPFTLVDTTQLLQLNLRNHTVGRKRAVHESYDVQLVEPFPLVRTLFHKGSVRWSHAGWPVVVEIPVGRGVVYVVTVPPRLLLSESNPAELAAFSVEILDNIFKTAAEEPLLTSEMLSTVGQGKIGYSIPERWFPAVVLGAFIILLAGVSFYLTRRQLQNRLLLAVPVCAALAVLPVMVTGMSSRTSAPATVIQTQVVEAASGQTSLAADGVATIFEPVSESMDLTLNHHATLAMPRSGLGNVRRRFTWIDEGKYEWNGFTQPAGITSYETRSIVQLPKTLSAVASFEDDAIVVRVQNSAMLAPQDAIIAGPGPDRMEARFLNEASEFRTEPTDLLAAGQISNRTLLSETQILRKQLYSEIFDSGGRLQPFPVQPSILFWTDQIAGAVESSSESLKHEASTLIALPLGFKAPAIGQSITLPPVLLPYVSVADENGAFSSALQNRQREWIERKQGSDTLLKFSLPDVCDPFYCEAASLELRIRAGSRTVKISVGNVGDFKEITSMSSPVGNMTIDLPVDLLNSTIDQNAVFLKLHVGELEIGTADDLQSSSEHDSFWKIDRVLLTLKGHRTSNVVPSEMETN